GLRIILDRHRPDCAAQAPLWYTRRYPEQRWIADLVRLALRYRQEPAVIGIDLHNEPHGRATWGDGNPATDWRLAAERAGNVVLPDEPAAVRAGARAPATLTRAQEGIWQRALVHYLAQHPTISFTYWTLTPDSSDTGGLLTDDWQTANRGKEHLLAGIQAAALPVPHAQPAPAPIRV